MKTNDALTPGFLTYFQPMLYRGDGIVDEYAELPDGLASFQAFSTKEDCVIWMKNHGYIPGSYVIHEYHNDDIEEVSILDAEGRTVGDGVSTKNKSQMKENLTFGQAIEALKDGKKVARKGWNGKGMYLWLLPPSEVKKEWVKDPMLLEAFGDRDVLPCLGSIRMLTATGEVLTGWLASQTDMLSEDWVILD